MFLQNLVYTSCYLSLEGELGELLHGRAGQRLGRVHAHAAEDDDDHGQDEEHAARHVDQDVRVIVLLLQLHCWWRSRGQRSEVKRLREGKSQLQIRISLRPFFLRNVSGEHPSPGLKQTFSFSSSGHLVILLPGQTFFFGCASFKPFPEGKGYHHQKVIGHNPMSSELKG